MPAESLITTYPFDPTGKKISNKITGEQQVLTAASFRDFHFIVPKFGPYFVDSLIVSIKTITNEVRLLNRGVDYLPSHWFIAASRACSAPIYGSISFLDLDLVGTLTLTYQTLGGDWVQDDTHLAEILADRLHNPRVTSWDVVVDMPYSFPVIDHEWDLVDMVGMKDVTTQLAAIAQAIGQSQADGLAGHLTALNPHGITPAMIGTLTTTQIQQRIDTAVANGGGGGSGGNDGDTLAMAALQAHTAATDPHPQYMTLTETNTAIDAKLASLPSGGGSGGTTVVSLPDDEAFFLG
jgi:hypothetical protein